MWLMQPFKAGFKKKGGGGGKQALLGWQCKSLWQDVRELGAGSMPKQCVCMQADQSVGSSRYSFLEGSLDFL